MKASYFWWYFNLLPIRRLVTTDGAEHSLALLFTVFSKHTACINYLFVSVCLSRSTLIKRVYYYYLPANEAATTADQYSWNHSVSQLCNGTTRHTIFYLNYSRCRSGCRAFLPASMFMDSLPKKAGKMFVHVCCPFSRLPRWQ